MKHDLAKDVLMTEVDMWAEIYRLREAVKGPEGYDSWQDAATAERCRRVKAEKELRDYKTEVSAHCEMIASVAKSMIRV